MACAHAHVRVQAINIHTSVLYEYDVHDGDARARDEPTVPNQALVRFECLECHRVYSAEEPEGTWMPLHRKPRWVQRAYRAYVTTRTADNLEHFHTNR